MTPKSSENLRVICGSNINVKVAWGSWQTQILPYRIISLSLSWDDRAITGKHNVYWAMQLEMRLKQFEQIIRLFKWVHAWFEPSEWRLHWGGDFLQCGRTREQEKEREEVVPADLALEARETEKSHLCLSAWQQPDLVYTWPWRPNNIFLRRWICFSFCGRSDWTSNLFFAELTEQMGCVTLPLAPNSRFVLRSSCY